MTPDLSSPLAGPCAGGDGQPPLVNLIARAQASFVADFEARLRASEIEGLSLAHSTNVLRHLSEGPRRAREIVERCGVTKQAISQQIAHLERNGYVAVGRDDEDQRARIVSLTPKGSAPRRSSTASSARSSRSGPSASGRRRWPPFGRPSPTSSATRPAEPGARPT